MEALFAALGASRLELLFAWAAEEDFQSLACAPGDLEQCLVLRRVDQEGICYERAGEEVVIPEDVTEGCAVRVRAEELAR